MKEKGKDKLSVTQGSYLPVTRQPQLLVYMVGTSGEWWLFRDPKERNMVLQMFGGVSPSQNGALGCEIQVTFGKGHGG